ncbi:MAG: heme exporter protein CcmB [Candidatus Latescibacterota bacterium]|nr:MAG: heme exporter protein CcmB [Candidatus Latescibacterota bacterium]
MWRAITTILWKDLKIELRTKEAFSASFVFSLMVLVIFNFTLDLTTEEAMKMGAGFLWIAFAFGGVLALNRSFALERDESCIQGLQLAPVDRGGVYLGKFLANVIFMLITELILLPLFAIFFNVDITGRLPYLVGVLVLGTVGFSSVGTLFSAIAVHTRMREVILPILLLPVTVPVLIAAVETTAYAMGADVEPYFWFRLLVVYDVIFVTVSFLTFGSILQE